MAKSKSKPSRRLPINAAPAPVIEAALEQSRCGQVFTNDAGSELTEHMVTAAFRYSHLEDESLAAAVVGLSVPTARRS